ncbi:hypothetical protein BDK51DRAFT_53005 [Blyttiomyces helicus]|uniref:Uncharacterized protein n=1 Tax=Blyttiomyces helicus TaxID=388810 RepID=A0A4V1IRU2_9FUNG|nr:hypothetical protein BDK51DRAFT_53005 [Blyttiomyces helicus]|eukprot:RKO91247.1 hypothetical protein BDK51DRAFT_53005 [Blyttiomyces helicus]
MASSDPQLVRTPDPTPEHQEPESETLDNDPPLPTPLEAALEQLSLHSIPPLLSAPHEILSPETDLVSQDSSKVPPAQLDSSSEKPEDPTDTPTSDVDSTGGIDGGESEDDARSDRGSIGDLSDFGAEPAAPPPPEPHLPPLDIRSRSRAPAPFSTSLAPPHYPRASSPVRTEYGGEDDAPHDADDLMSVRSVMTTRTLKQNRQPVSKSSKISRMQSIFTESQKIAYVGLCYLAISHFKKSRLTGMKKAAAAYDKWAAVFMERLYIYLDLIEAERVMIKNLAEHGLVPSDLSSTILSDARKAAERLKSESERRQQAEQEALDQGLPVDLTEEIVADADLSDVRYTIISHLFVLCISDGQYDARSRAILRVIAEHLEVPWLDVIKLENTIADQLRIYEDSDEVKPDQMIVGQRNKKDAQRRWLFTGLATLAGGVAIGLTAGLAAPLIAGGIGVALGTFGVTGASAVLGSTSAIALITTGGVLTGGAAELCRPSRSPSISAFSGMGGAKMMKRTRGISQFEFVTVEKGLLLIDENKEKRRTERRKKRRREARIALQEKLDKAAKAREEKEAEARGEKPLPNRSKEEEAAEEAQPVEEPVEAPPPPYEAASSRATLERTSAWVREASDPTMSAGSRSPPAMRSPPMTPPRPASAAVDRPKPLNAASSSTSLSRPSLTSHSRQPSQELVPSSSSLSRSPSPGPQLTPLAPSHAHQPLHEFTPGISPLEPGPGLIAPPPIAAGGSWKRGPPGSAFAQQTAFSPPTPPPAATVATHTSSPATPRIALIPSANSDAPRDSTVLWETTQSEFEDVGTTIDDSPLPDFDDTLTVDDGTVMDDLASTVAGDDDEGIRFREPEGPPKAKQTNVLITVAGWITYGFDDHTLPFSTLEPGVHGDQYALAWETDTLQELGSALKLLVGEVASFLLQQGLQATVLAGLMVGLTGPLWVLKLSYLVDNPWGNGLTKANKAGRVGFFFGCLG